VIDWHCHILPGLDDGPSDPEQSLSMAGLLSQAGFNTVYCTPHLMPGRFEATNEQVRQGVKQLQQTITRHGIPLVLQPGREYYLDELLPEILLDSLPLGDSRLLLIEIPSDIPAETAGQLLYGIVRSGFTPVIAHPERCPLLEPALQLTERRSIWSSLRRLLHVQPRPQEKQHFPSESTGNPLLEYLRDLGCLFQGDLGSFNGLYGQRARTSAETLRRLNVFDRYGSDLHFPLQAKSILKKDAYSSAATGT
jgi:protein-tyrosine phosphatase